MNILILGPSGSPITSFLRHQGHSTTEHFDPIDIEFLEENGFEFAVSYRYRHLIRQETIDFFEGRIINLHVSYLPWNRGSDPNLWSFLEDTPKGVSIHYVDSGVDTGEIITQKQVYFDEPKHTLSTSYEILNKKIISLFKENWELIARGDAPSLQQPEGGSLHKLKDKEPYLYLLSNKGWDTPVLEIKGKALA